MEIYQSVAMLPLVHQGVRTPAFCRYCGGRPPFWGGPWELGETSWPGADYSSGGVRTAADFQLGFRLYPSSDTKEKRKFHSVNW